MDVLDPRLVSTAHRQAQVVRAAQLAPVAFKIDDQYVAEPPPREVSFFGLAPSVTRAVLDKACKVYGELAQMKIYVNEDNGHSVGIARVVYTRAQHALSCVQRCTTQHRQLLGESARCLIDRRGAAAKETYDHLIREYIRQQRADRARADASPATLEHERQLREQQHPATSVDVPSTSAAHTARKQIY